MAHICPKCHKRYGFLDQLKGAEMCSACAAVEGWGKASEPLHRSGISVDQHAVAALPLALMFIGGALGGICGAAAYSLSIWVFKKKEIPIVRRYVYSVLISGAGAAVYFSVVVALVLLFPLLFRRH